MSTRRAAALICLLAPLIATTRLQASDQPAKSSDYAVFHVGGTGSYANIADALRAAQDYKRTHAAAPVRIEIASGDYYLDAPLKIGPSLSGDAKHPTEIVAASADQPPRLLAGRKLAVRWQPYRRGIVQAKVDGAAFDQLYVDGLAQVRARYPDFDGKVAVLGGYAADALAPERVARWHDPAGAIVQALHDKRWGGMQMPILGKRADGSLILGDAVGNNRPSLPHATYRYVENVFEELDAAGEWFCDVAQSTVYFMPPIGVDPNRATIEVSGPARVLDLQGTARNPLRHVRIAGLTIEHAGATFLHAREPLLRTDWMIARDAALYLERTEDVRIEDSEFSALAGNAIFVSGYNRRVTIAHNHIHDIAGGGINFIGRSDAVRSPSFQYDQFVPLERIDRTPGPNSQNYPADSLAEDNLIHGIGGIEKQVAGVEIDIAKNIRVAHNSIYEVPRAGINIGDGAFGGHLVEFNDVFDTVLETGDHGAFNAWGRDRFWHPDRKVMDRINANGPQLWKLDVLEPITLRNNRFRCDHGWDVDLDDGSSNYRIYDNVLLAGGLKFREGFSRQAWNNVLVNNGFHPHVWFARSGDTFERNIVMAGHQPILMSHWDATIDRNLFPTMQTLDAAHRLGLDGHSAFGDADFINAARGDFRVEDTSPALALGFRNFPMDAFGVTSPRLKGLARTAPIPELVSSAAAQPDRTYAFLGAEVKTIASVGEQSAAGLAEIAGVLVLSVRAGSLAAKSGLQVNDVIVRALADSFGNPSEDIANVSDLLRLVSARAWRSEVPVAVMRNQRLQWLTLETQQN